VRVALPDVPVTVTVPDSGGGAVEPPPPLLLLPPQLTPATNKIARTPPSATCRRFHEWADAPDHRLYRVVSRRQSMATAISHRESMCGPARNAGSDTAVDEAVTVTVAVLLLLRVPTEQVTPARALEALQVKVGVAEKLSIGFNVRVDVPLAPGAKVRLLGATLREKSGAAVAKLETLDHAPLWPLPEGARACTSQ
jgi:hypothetical protein